MLFELKAGREINLEFIVSMNKHSEHYEICLAGGHKYHIPESKYLEIKKYFDAKNLKGVFVEGEKKEDVPVVNLPFITPITINRKDMMNVFSNENEAKEFADKNINPSADLNIYQKAYLDTFKKAWNVLPPIHDIQHSTPKPEKDYLSDVMEKIRQENADCKKCANAKIECNTCLVYHGGKHHFTNLKVTGESVKNSAFDVWFFINSNQIHTANYVLKQLVNEKVIKDFNIETQKIKSLITITKG